MPSAFHSSIEWQRTRARQLRREPLCRMCMKTGIIKPAVEVDHIVPVSKEQTPTLAINLQSLCKAHHVANERRTKRRAL